MEAYLAWKYLMEHYVPYMHVTHWIVEFMLIVIPVLDVYRDSCWNVRGTFSSKAEQLSLRLALGRHVLINIAAAEAV